MYLRPDRVAEQTTVFPEGDTKGELMRSFKSKGFILLGTQELSKFHGILPRDLSHIPCEIYLSQAEED